MKYTVDFFREEMNKKIEEYNETYNKNIPLINFEVSISSRMTRCRGYYECKHDFTPVRIRFSKDMINHNTHEEIMNTCYHELAHYIANTQYQKNIGHGKEWKNICKKIGMINISRLYKIDEEAMIRYRYNIYCPDCGKIISFKSRLTNNMKHQYENNLRMCRECNCDKLEVIDNKLGKRII